MSNTHRAGSGMRPNVGRTDRSQPKTSPMIERAAARGEAERQAADGDGQQADEAADHDAEADEDHVGLARRPLDVAERRAGALDVRLGAGEPEQVAAVDDRGRPERDLLAAADELHQDDAAAVLLGQRLERAGRPALWLVSDDVEGDHREVEQLPVVRPRRRTARAAGEQHVPARRHGDDVARRGARSAGPGSTSASPRRIRSTNTRSGANAFSRSPTVPPANRCRPRRGRRARPTRGRPTASPVSDFGAPDISASSLRLSAFRFDLAAAAARGCDRNQTTKPGAHQVADRVGHRDVVQQPLLLGLGQRRAGRSCRRRCR